MKSRKPFGAANDFYNERFLSIFYDFPFKKKA